MSSRQTRALTLIAGHGAVLLLAASQALDHPNLVRPLVLESGIQALPIFALLSLIGVVVSYVALMAAEKDDFQWPEVIAAALFLVMGCVFVGLLFGVVSGYIGPPSS